MEREGMKEPQHRTCAMFHLASSAGGSGTTGGTINVLEISQDVMGLGFCTYHGGWVGVVVREHREQLKTLGFTFM